MKAIYQAVSADGVAGTGVAVAVTASARAQVGSPRYPLEPGRARLTREAGVTRWTPIREVTHAFSVRRCSHWVKKV